MIPHPASAGALRCRLLVLALVAAALLAVPAGATANVLPAATVTLPVKVLPSIGGYAIGSSAMTVSYTDTQATAVASSASVGLGPGHIFHVDVCIKAHWLNNSFNTTCAQRIVDTSSNLVPVYLAASTATAAMQRPAAGGKAYFSFELSISDQQPDNSFKEVASSWPGAGLASASVAVPAVGATSAPAPTSEGAALSGYGTGGINSGLPDSFCEGFQYPQPAPPGAGVSTTALGAGAPAYYEVGEPTGAYAGLAPRGVMVVINGGGWYMNGPAMVAGNRGEADQWRAQGWRTVNITYRPCNQSFADVQWFYDHARQLWGSSVPYCALGGSAGGNLALMLAASRSSVDCVISEAGPTDAGTIKTETTPVGGNNGPAWVYNLLSAAAGPENTFWWSPALFAIHARVLWAISASDPYIPWAQGTELQTKMQGSNPGAYVDLMQLASGTVPWVHANVSSDALSSFQAHEQQLVAPLLGS